MSRVVDRVKQVAQQDPKLSGVARRLIVTMARNAVSRDMRFAVDQVAAAADTQASTPQNPRQVAAHYVQRIKQASSLRQMRRLEATALEEIAAARNAGRK